MQSHTFDQDEAHDITQYATEELEIEEEKRPIDKDVLRITDE